jgi:hypothetical protein
MQSPAEVTFRQIRSRLLADAIVLRHDRVIVRTGLPESPDERHIPLGDVACEIEITDRRSFGALWVILIFGAIFAAAAWKVSGPSPLAFTFAVLFGSMALSCIIAGFIVCAPVAVATVRNRKGEVLFELTREQEVAADYEVFLLQLQRRLKFRNEDSHP